MHPLRTASTLISVARSHGAMITLALAWTLASPLLALILAPPHGADATGLITTLAGLILTPGMFYLAARRSSHPLPTALTFRVLSAAAVGLLLGAGATYTAAAAWAGLALGAAAVLLTDAHTRPRWMPQLPVRRRRAWKGTCEQTGLNLEVVHAEAHTRPHPGRWHTMPGPRLPDDSHAGRLFLGPTGVWLVRSATVPGKLRRGDDGRLRAGKAPIDAQLAQAAWAADVTAAHLGLPVRAVLLVPDKHLPGPVVDVDVDGGRQWSILIRGKALTLTSPPRTVAITSPDRVGRLLRSVPVTLTAGRAARAAIRARVAARKPAPASATVAATRPGRALPAKGKGIGAWNDSHGQRVTITNGTPVVLLNGHGGYPGYVAVSPVVRYAGKATPSGPDGTLVRPRDLVVWVTHHRRYDTTTAHAFPWPVDKLDVIAADPEATAPSAPTSPER